MLQNVENENKFKVKDMPAKSSNKQLNYSLLEGALLTSESIRSSMMKQTEHPVEEDSMEPYMQSNCFFAACSYS